MDLARAKDDVNSLCLQAEDQLSWYDKSRLAVTLRWWAEELEKQSWLDLLDVENRR